MPLPLPQLTRTVRILIQDFGKYRSNTHRKLRKISLSKAIKKASPRIRAYMEAETIRRGIYDKGIYSRAWRVKVGNQALSSAVYNKRSYAIVIEKGRRPGRRPPPSSALVPWVQRNIGASGKRARTIAFLIARAIGRRGIRARPVIGNFWVRMHIRKIVAREAYLQLKAALR